MEPCVFCSRPTDPTKSAPTQGNFACQSCTTRLIVERITEDAGADELMQQLIKKLCDLFEGYPAFMVAWATATFFGVQMYSRTDEDLDAWAGTMMAMVRRSVTNTRQLFNYIEQAENQKPS